MLDLIYNAIWLFIVVLTGTVLVLTDATYTVPILAGLCAAWVMVS